MRANVGLKLLPLFALKIGFSNLVMMMINIYIYIYISNTGYQPIRAPSELSTLIGYIKEKKDYLRGAQYINLIFPYQTGDPVLNSLSIFAVCFGL